MSERDEFEALRRLVAAVARVDASFDDAGSVLSDALGEQAAALGHARAVIAAHVPQAVPALTDGEIETIHDEIFGNAGFLPDQYRQFAHAIRALFAAPQPSPEPLTECAEIDPEAWKSLKAHAHDWRFSLQDHLYKCDCGATRGDYPFGAASFKD